MDERHAIAARPAPPASLARSTVSCGVCGRPLNAYGPVLVHAGTGAIGCWPSKGDGRAPLFGSSQATVRLGESDAQHLLAFVASAMSETIDLGTLSALVSCAAQLTRQVAR